MNSVILLAGGLGSRFGSDLPKQYVALGGKPLVLHSFEKLRGFGELVVVCEPEWERLFEGADRFARPGKSRAESVRNGVEVSSGEWLIVHDGARPHFDVECLERCIEAAYENGACALAVSSVSTLRQWDEQGVKRLNREVIWEVQTPQVVRRDLYLAGYDVVDEATDELSVVEAIGHEPALVEGNRENIKVTYGADLVMAEGLCNAISS